MNLADCILHTLSSELPYSCRLMGKMSFNASIERLQIKGVKYEEADVISNLTSPFILFNACEMVFQELSFLNNEDSYYKLYSHYMQVLTDVDIILSITKEESNLKGTLTKILNATNMNNPTISTSRDKKDKKLLRKKKQALKQIHINRKKLDAAITFLEDVCTIIGVRLSIMKSWSVLKMASSYVDEFDTKKNFFTPRQMSTITEHKRNSARSHVIKRLDKCCEALMLVTSTDLQTMKDGSFFVVRSLLDIVRCQGFLEDLNYELYSITMFDLRKRLGTSLLFQEKSKELDWYENHLPSASILTKLLSRVQQTEKMYFEEIERKTLPLLHIGNLKSDINDDLIVQSGVLELCEPYFKHVGVLMVQCDLKESNPNTPVPASSSSSSSSSLLFNKEKSIYACPPDGELHKKPNKAILDQFPSYLAEDFNLEPDLTISPLIVSHKPLFYQCYDTVQEHTRSPLPNNNMSSEVSYKSVEGEASDASMVPAARSRDNTVKTRNSLAGPTALIDNSNPNTHLLPLDKQWPRVEKVVHLLDSVNSRDRLWSEASVFEVITRTPRIEVADSSSSDPSDDTDIHDPERERRDSKAILPDLIKEHILYGATVISKSTVLVYIALEREEVLMDPPSNNTITGEGLLGPVDSFVQAIDVLKQTMRADDIFSSIAT